MIFLELILCLQSIKLLQKYSNAEYKYLKNIGEFTLKKIIWELQLFWTYLLINNINPINFTMYYTVFEVSVLKHRS
jgi:hypothetical protein